jgi:hypothetical protein
LCEARARSAGTLPATEKNLDRYVDQVSRLLTASDAGQERVEL